MSVMRSVGVWPGPSPLAVRGIGAASVTVSRHGGLAVVRLLDSRGLLLVVFVVAGCAAAVAQRAAAFGDAAVDCGVAGVCQPLDLLVGVAEALEVERLAFARLQRRYGGEAFAMFEARERAVLGAGRVGVRG